MRTVVVIAVLLGGCSKNESAEEAEASMRRRLETELVDAKHRGPGAAIKPEPVAPVTTPGPAYLSMGANGIVKLDVAGAASLIDTQGMDPLLLATSRTGDLYTLA